MCNLDAMTSNPEVSSSAAADEDEYNKSLEKCGVGGGESGDPQLFVFVTPEVQVHFTVSKSTDGIGFEIMEPGDFEPYYAEAAGSEDEDEPGRDREVNVARTDGNDVAEEMMPLPRLSRLSPTGCIVFKEGKELLRGRKGIDKKKRRKDDGGGEVLKPLLRDGKERSTDRIGDENSDDEKKRGEEVSSERVVEDNNKRQEEKGSMAKGVDDERGDEEKGSSISKRGVVENPAEKEADQQVATLTCKAALTACKVPSSEEEQEHPAAAATPAPSTPDKPPKPPKTPEKPSKKKGKKKKPPVSPAASLSSQKSSSTKGRGIKKLSSFGSWSGKKGRVSSSSKDLNEAKSEGVGRFATGGPYIEDAISDIHKEYDVDMDKELGSGQYGIVRKCEDKFTGDVYAVKTINKGRIAQMDVLMREVRLLRSVDHPNIIRLVDVFEDQRDVHLVTELCGGGELFDRIVQRRESPQGKFSEWEAAAIVSQILDAVSYLHDAKNIVHRDLKPENFLFDTADEDVLESSIKIIDFGYAIQHNKKCKPLRDEVGTPLYMSPEVMNSGGKGKKGGYDRSCDVWSVGVIAYTLLAGYPPFNGANEKEIYDSVRDGKFRFPSPVWDDVSPSAKDFICKVLKKDPKMRISAGEARKHPWIKEYAPEESTKKKVGRRVSMRGSRRLSMRGSMKRGSMKRMSVSGVSLRHLSAAFVAAEGEEERRASVGRRLSAKIGRRLSGTA